MDTNTISDCIIVRCPICGRPYAKWSTIGGDQSACPRCRNEGLQNTPFNPYLPSEFPRTRPDSVDAYEKYMEQYFMTSTKSGC